MRRLPAAAAVACLSLLAAPSVGAAAPTEIRAVFLKEYSLATYSVDQGDLVTFANQDPFLEHGVSSDDLDLGDQPLFSAEAVPAGARRLVRGSPFLTTGTYLFHDPAHPEMTSQLEVSAEGEPLAPDVEAPSVSASIRSTAAKQVAGRRTLRIRVNPSEPVDLALSASVGGQAAAPLFRTFVAPGPRTVSLKLGKKAARALGAKVRRLSRRGRKALAASFTAEAADVAGLPASAGGSRTLRLPPPPKRERR